LLEFEEIRLNYAIIRSIGDVELPIPKSFFLYFSDDELKEESIPKLENALSEHDFTVDDADIKFQIYFDEQWRKYKILMDVAYWYLESEGDKGIPDIETVEKLYRPDFEEFYKKNRPY